MQTVAGTRNGTAGSPDNRGHRVGHGHKPWSRKAEKETLASARKRNGFLTGRLLPAASGLCVEADGVRTEVATTANLDYLYRSAANYAGLLGVKLKFNCKKYARLPKSGMAELYRIFDAIVPENVNIELDGGRPVFCLYRFNDWPGYEVLWLPLDFTEKLSKDVRRVTLEFIRRFARHNGMLNITVTYHFSIAEDWLADDDGWQEGCAGADRRRTLRLLESYSNGRISRLFKRMGGRAFCRDLERALDSCRPEGEAEQALLGIIKDGLPLIGKGKPSIMDYEYDWAWEDDSDIMPAGLESQILLAYSLDDAVAGEVLQAFSADIREGYNLTPLTRLLITPETDRVFTEDRFPECFAEWFYRFVGHIRENFNIKRLTI